MLTKFKKAFRNMEKINKVYYHLKFSICSFDFFIVPYDWDAFVVYECVIVPNDLHS